MLLYRSNPQKYYFSTTTNRSYVTHEIDSVTYKHKTKDNDLLKNVERLLIQDIPKYDIFSNRIIMIPANIQKIFGKGISNLLVYVRLLFDYKYVLVNIMIKYCN